MELKVGNNSFIFNFKKAPLAAIVALMIIVAFEAFNVIFDDRMDDYPYDGLFLKTKNTISQTKDTSFDVLIMGDCFHFEGANAKTIEDMTGLKTFNYATFSRHTILSSYFLLKNHLEHNRKKPQIIVLNFIPETTFYSEKNFKEKAFPFMFHMKDGNFLSFVQELGFDKAVQLQLPSLKNRDFFIKGKFLKGFADRQKIIDFKKHVMDVRGHYSLPEGNFYKDALPPLSLVFVYEPSPFFLKYLHKILDLAKQNNILVLYPMFTAPDDMYNNLYMASHVIELYFALLIELKKEYPNLVYWGWQDDFSNRELYRDSIHLNRQGSMLMSQKLAEVISIIHRKLNP